MTPKVPLDIKLVLNAFRARVWLRFFHLKMSVKRTIKGHFWAKVQGKIVNAHPDAPGGTRA
jgi:hypothetical protein